MPAPDDRYILAIDGGNSKTDVAVLTRSGQVMTQLRGPGVSHHVLGLDGAVDALQDLAGRALGQLGHPLDPTVVAHTGAYLAGADLAREEAELHAAIAARGWSQSVRVDNDTFALLRAGSPAGVGVAVVCGAGINCVAVGHDSSTIRFPSLGVISGDWGGGLQLGREVMSAAARDEDGRGPATELRRRLLDQFDARTVLQVIEALHFNELPSAELHTLTPLLFEVAAGGDRVAADLVLRLAAEVAAFATAAIARLDWAAAPIPVVLGGAVLAAGHPMLDQAIRQRVSAAAPMVEYYVVTAPPILGAALLALDEVNGGTGNHTAATALRRFFADRPLPTVHDRNGLPV